MYSARPDGLGNTDPGVIAALTGPLDRELDAYSRNVREAGKAPRLQHSLRRHRVINQAVGILMATDRLTPPEATAALHRRATDRGTGPEQAAQDVINQHRNT
jgi:AmiR/NasT family two-component response regulator